MPDVQVRWYSSKMDGWVVPLLCLPPLGAVMACVAGAMSGSAPSLVAGVAAAVVVTGVYLGLLFPMKYGLDDSHLVVSFGLVRRRVALADISEVSPTRSPLSSPALSLDRLLVKFGPGAFDAVMISPAERDSFLDELTRKAGLTRDGDRLIRK
jgi:hypothetical protein